MGKGIPSVYFCGPVTDCNWRDRLIADRIMSSGHEIYTIGRLKFRFAGPVALSDDHRGFHNPSSHGVVGPSVTDGVGLAAGVPETEGLSQKDAVHRCLEQINQADYIFAYLPRNGCNGSLLELGYAVHAGKPIALLCHPGLWDELWFIRQCAIYTAFIKAFPCHRIFEAALNALARG